MPDPRRAMAPRERTQDPLAPTRPLAALTLLQQIQVAQTALSPNLESPLRPPPVLTTSIPPLPLPPSQIPHPHPSRPTSTLPDFRSASDVFFPTHIPVQFTPPSVGSTRTDQIDIQLPEIHRFPSDVANKPEPPATIIPPSGRRFLGSLHDTVATLLANNATLQTQRSTLAAELKAYKLRATRLASEAASNQAALFLLSKIVTSELPITALSKHLSAPHGWLAFAQLLRADLIDCYGGDVLPTQRGIDLLKRLRSSRLVALPTDEARP